MEQKTCAKILILMFISMLSFMVFSSNQFLSIVTLRPFDLHKSEFNKSANQTENSIQQNKTQSNYVLYPQLPILFHEANISKPENKTKLILLGNSFFGDRIWEFAAAEKTSEQMMTTLTCPFLSNFCSFTTDLNRINQSDAIIYHLRDGIDRRLLEQARKPYQRVVFALWESPAHTPNLQGYRNFFNWTMTYRFDSDIIASYYAANHFVSKSSLYYKRLGESNRQIPFRSMNSFISKEAIANKKLGVAAALISNCGGSSDRRTFIDRLSKYIDVHVYGRCGKPCPPKEDCRKFIADNYYFILSFENSLCQDYVTEKFFAALELPAVPIVLGRANYSRFIPSSGYIDSRQFPTILSLATFLNETKNDEKKYQSYFAWKADFVWGGSHFFSPLCDLCLRLHLDDRPKIIDDIHSWWFNNACIPAKTPT